MKTRRRMMADQLEKVRADLDECRADRVAVHEKLAKAEHDAAEQRARADAAEHEHGLAVAHRDRLQVERDAARAQADGDRQALRETIGLRDGWSERAQSVTVERDEALALLASQQEARHEAERKHEDLLLVTRQWESRSIEAREQADLAVTERNEAWRERDELRQALRDCRESRSIIQTQRDTILAAGAEQGIMIPMPGGPTPKLERDAEEAVVESRDGVVIEGEFVPTVVGGRAVPLMTPYVERPIEANLYDDHPGPAGAERLRFEDAAFDAMRDALLAITATEPYDPDAVSDKLRRALGMMDSSGHHVREQFGTVARTADRTLIDHWQGVAKRLESRYDAVVRDNRALTDRANEATTRAAMAERSYSELHSRLVGMMAERDAAVEDLEREREQGLLPPDEMRQGYASYVALRGTLEAVERERDDLRTENEALNSEREDALEALRQVKAERDRLKPLAMLADAVAAQSKIADATVRMDRAEAEFANLRDERDQAVQAVRREVGQMQAERDAARADAERARSLAMDSMIVDGALENALGKLAGMVGVDQATIESPADILEAAMHELREMRETRAGVGDVARLGRALGIEKWNPSDVDVPGTIDTAIRRMAALDRERLSARSEAGALKLTLAIIDERQRQRGDEDSAEPGARGDD